MMTEFWAESGIWYLLHTPYTHITVACFEGAVRWARKEFGYSDEN